jgi:hypothetical protein
MVDTKQRPKAGRRNQARKPTKAKKKLERSLPDEPTPPGVRLWAIQEQVKGGRPIDMANLNAVLDLLPDEVRKLGDLQRLCDSQLITRIAGKDVVLRVCIQREIVKLRAKIAGTNSSPIGELLIDDVIENFLLMKLIHFRSMLPSPSIQESAFLVRQGVSAQRRYHSSIEQLARFQKVIDNPKPNSSQERPRNEKAPSGYVIT